MNRFYRVDLGEPPKVRLLGFTHFESGERRWQVPADNWHLMMPDHSGVVQLGSRLLTFQGGNVIILPPRATARLAFDDSALSGHWFCLFNLAAGVSSQVALTTISDLGLEYHWWRDRFTYLSNWAHITEAHKAPHIWSLLWRVAKPAEEIRLHPYVKVAESLMRERMSTPIRIEDLCEELQVSQSHLNRLFREEYGVGPKRFLLDLRVSQAVNLLRETTKPLKEVAAAVGIYDMQQFNKIMRQAVGLSPSAIRHNPGTPADFVAATPEIGVAPEDRPEYGKNALKQVKKGA